MIEIEQGIDEIINIIDEKINDIELEIKEKLKYKSWNNIDYNLEIMIKKIRLKIYIFILKRKKNKYLEKYNAIQYVSNISAIDTDIVLGKKEYCFMKLEHITYLEANKNENKSYGDGNLYITNKSIIFVNNILTKNIKINDIIDINKIFFGIRISKIRGKAILLKKLLPEDIYKISALLSAIKNNQINDNLIRNNKAE